MSEKVHEVPESTLEELFLEARATARRCTAAESLADALEFAEKALSPPPKALLPCPFCGGKAMPVIPDPGQMELRCVECTVCSARSHAVDDRRATIAAWNRRTIPTAPTVDPAASIPGGVAAVADAAMPNWLKGLDGADYSRMCRELWREAFAAGWAAHKRSLAAELPPGTPDELRPGREVI